MLHAFLWPLVISQALENRLAHASAACFHHVFYDAYEFGRNPYSGFIAAWHCKWRMIDTRQIPDAPEGIAANAECDVSFIYQLPCTELAEHDAGHIVFFGNIAADDEIIIQ